MNARPPSSSTLCVLQLWKLPLRLMKLGFLQSFLCQVQDFSLPIICNYRQGEKHCSCSAGNRRCCRQGCSAYSSPLYAEDIDAGGDASPSTRMLSEVSRSLKITIIGGSIPEHSGDKLYNSCGVFGTDGKLLAKHRKIHLFDIDIPGKMTFKESRTLTAGARPTIVDTEVGRIGIGICYDIRFQELVAIYAGRGAHLLCYPGAFNMTIGPLHWELLQRARAADCQLYVATCSPARDNGSSYVAWGHSTLVGPFGEVLVTTEQRRLH